MPMWLYPLAAFLLITLVCLTATMLFLRAGKDQTPEVLTGRGRRRLLFGPLTVALSGIVPTTRGKREQLTQFLRHAGHYHRLALAEFLALRNALVVGWVLLVLAAIVAATQPGDGLMYQMLVVGLLVAVVLYSLPRLFLEAAAKARVRRIEESLPDALDMITMCMSGGLPLQLAMTRVSDELQSTHPDLAFELRIVGRQMDAGSLDSAVTAFAGRIDAPEIHSLAAIIRQTERQGSGVAGTFEKYADNVRLNRRQRAEEVGNKTAVKLLFPLVFCLAPPVYIMLLAPAVIELSDFVRRESSPGGALSASADNMRNLLQQTPPVQTPAARTPITTPVQPPAPVPGTPTTTPGGAAPSPSGGGGR